MVAPAALMVRAAGTNTDEETVKACQQAGFKVSLQHVNRLVENPSLFSEYQFFVVPGGWSYGDHLGSGRVLANELRLRLSDPIRKFAQDGKLVLGICNGFQILVKSGILPDPGAFRQTTTLTFNASGRFEDRWIRMKAVGSKCVMLKDGMIYETAVTHGEGRFVAPAETMDKLQGGGQLVLKYVDEKGMETQQYPDNPNGSPRAIAGICDATGRILGMMPHPEKHQFSTQHPLWTRTGMQDANGMAIFRAAFDYLKG